MNRSILIIALPLLSVTAIYAQRTPGKVLTVSGTRFTYPLVQQWIDDYRKLAPDLEIRLVSPRDPAAAHADLKITAAPQQPGRQRPGYTYINVARYALLPVANSKSAYADGRPISVQALHQLYFDDERLSREKDVVVYNRREKSCAPVTFATYYGAAFEDIKGRSIPGDDRQLLQAVQDDEKAVSYNNPGFIYDLKSRLPVEHISVIPIDLNANGQLDADENFYGSLDQLVQRLETAPPAAIPVASVIFYYNNELADHKPYLKHWLQFIQDKGQQQLHSYGFLSPANGRQLAQGK